MTGPFPAEQMVATISLLDVALIVIRVLALVAIGGLVYGMYIWQQSIWKSYDEE
jgi:hypothetical protein